MTQALNRTLKRWLGQWRSSAKKESEVDYIAPGSGTPRKFFPPIVGGMLALDRTSQIALLPIGSGEDPATALAVSVVYSRTDLERDGPDAVFLLDVDEARRLRDMLDRFVQEVEEGHDTGGGER